MKSKSFTPPHTRNPIDRFRWWMRDIRLKEKRKQLINTNFSIISNNCIGGMVTHDFLQPQLSPTVNLFILPDDYLRLLKDLNNNLQSDVVKVESGRSFPAGMVNGCKINFMHYKTFEEGKQAWIKRAQRIDYNNLLVVLVERDGCTYDNLKEFDSLPFVNKIAIVHKPYPEIQCAVVVPGYENTKDVGRITDWCSLFGEREYDRIDWPSVLNNIKKMDV